MCTFSQLAPVLAAVAVAIKFNTTMDDQCPVVGDTGTGRHSLRSKLIPNRDGSESALAVGSAPSAMPFVTVIDIANCQSTSTANLCHLIAESI